MSLHPQAEFAPYYQQSWAVAIGIDEDWVLFTACQCL